MNRTPHTPGPWHNRWGKVTDGQDKAICMLNLRKGSHNGNLISAAPDLLTALKSLCSICEDDDQHPTFTEAARDAIAKAEGEA